MITTSALAQPQTTRWSSSSATFHPNKKDKRIIKRSLLHARIVESKANANNRRTGNNNTPPPTTTTTKKRRARRPSRKLVTDLNSLADALPNDDDDNDAAVTAPAGEQRTDVNIIKRRSLKSRPGATKRKEKLDSSERERFAKNMVQMSTAAATTTTTGGCCSDGTEGGEIGGRTRWVALRNFITQTIEQKEEFKKKSS